MDEPKHDAPTVAVEPFVGQIPPGRFESKYGLGEIVELKQEGAHMFCARVLAVTFLEMSEPQYTVRRPDGAMLVIFERELCIRGVDDIPPNAKAHATPRHGVNHD